MTTAANQMDQTIVFVEGSIRGPVIVCSTDAIFPSRCVICNAPDSRRVMMHFAIYPKREFNPLNYLSTRRLVLAEAMHHTNGRRGQAEIGLCQAHAFRQGKLATLLGGMAIASLAIGAAGMWLVSDHRIDSMLGILFYLAAIAGCAATAWWGTRTWPLLTPRGISDRQMRLSGAGKAFLASLEKAPAPAVAASSPIPPRPTRR